MKLSVPARDDLEPRNPPNACTIMVDGHAVTVVRLNQASITESEAYATHAQLHAATRATEQRLGPLPRLARPAPH